MDYRTWNRLQPGDIVKGPLGLIYEVVQVEAYRRSKPDVYRSRRLINDNGEVYRLYRYKVQDYTLITPDDKSYKAYKALYSKSNV